jgi:hypothetical protein
LLVVEDDIRCSCCVDICSGAAAAARAFQITAKVLKRIVPDRRYRKFEEIGAKKVFSYNAMKRFVVGRHSRPPEPPVESLNRGLAEAPPHAKSQI